MNCYVEAHPPVGRCRASWGLPISSALQMIVGNIVTPLVLLDSVQINPLLCNVAMLLGSELAGPAGAVLGMPIAAVLQVVVVRVLTPIARLAAARASRPASLGQEQGMG